MSSEVFIVSSAPSGDASEAIRRAVEIAGIGPSRVQDVVFGLDRTSSIVDATQTVRKAGLICRAVSVSSGLRALIFAAQSILSGDVEVTAVAGGGDPGFVAFVLTAPEPIGRWNLMPRARLAARSLAGKAGALRAAGLGPEEIAASKQGDSLLLVSKLLDQMEHTKVQWGMVSDDEVVLLMELVL